MIIDAHCHFGPMSRQYVKDYSLKKFLERMDRYEIETAISCACFSLGTLDQKDFVYGAALSSALLQESNGRLFSYHYFEPNLLDESLQIMEQYANDPAFVGVKIHPSWSLTSGDDERYRPAWEFAHKYNLPILAHTWDLSPANPKQAFAFPARFEKYVREYPDVSFILGHSGGRTGGIRSMVALAKAYPNVYGDIAGDIWPNHLLEHLVSELGAERILYGSDYVMMDHGVMLGVVMGADLSLADKEKILYHNAKELFKL